MSLRVEQIQAYCERYFVPEAFLMEILEDQMVLPMIRGKASEYNAYLYLRNNLDSMIWDVQKLNLNAQNDMNDEDVSITHRRTGIRLKMEVKNATRGSFRDGTKGKGKSGIPYFTVKCHKSRSNMKKFDTTNDRYLIGEFDIVMSNTSNALYEGGSIDETLRIIQKPQLVASLKEFYHCKTDIDLERNAYNDWRFAIPAEISEDGISIPRSPRVLLTEDPKWFSISSLSDKMQRIVNEKWEQRHYRR